MTQWRPNPEICLYCIICGAAVENAGQERKFIGGSQQISNRLKDKLGDRVVLNSPVCRLMQDADHVVVTCEDGKKYQAQFVIN